MRAVFTAIVICLGIGGAAGLTSAEVSAAPSHVELAHPEEEHEESTPTVLPSDAKPPGERDPRVGAIAVAAMVVVAVAGVFIYSTIRKGL